MNYLMTFADGSASKSFETKEEALKYASSMGLEPKDYALYTVNVNTNCWR